MLLFDNMELKHITDDSDKLDEVLLMKRNRTLLPTPEYKERFNLGDQVLSKQQLSS